MKTVCALVLNLILSLCLCSCTANISHLGKPDFRDEALAYMEEKYGEAFIWEGPVDGMLGRDEASGYVSCNSFPGEKILVSGQSEGESYTFSDNYLEYLFNEEATQTLQSLIDGKIECRIICKPAQTPRNMDYGKDITVMEYLQIGGVLANVIFPEVPADRDAAMEQIRQLLWEQRISANMSVYFGKESEPAGTWNGRFIMNSDGEYAVSRWR